MLPLTIHHAILPHTEEELRRKGEWASVCAIWDTLSTWHHLLPSGIRGEWPQYARERIQKLLEAGR